MKRNFKIIFFSMMISMMFVMEGFAARLNPDLPDTFAGLTLDNDGKASFIPPDYSTISASGQTVLKWKKYEAQLLKRVTTINPVNGLTVWSYKTSGSIKSCSADENEINFTFSSVGYYQFQVRGVDLEGNYTRWVRESEAAGGDEYFEGLPITEDDIGAGGGSSGGGSGSGSGGNSTTGPGVVQTGNIPAGYQYAVVGPNGEIMYYYGGNASNGIYSGIGYGNNGMAYYQQSGSSQIYGPAYANNMAGGSQILYPNTGVSNYQQVQAPNVNGSNIYSGQAGTSGINNPNYSVGGTNMSVSPQITQGLEVGWHVDNNGRFYYQGNGVVLKSTWYLIDAQYYRFGDNGYLLANQWFKDQTTGAWYYLSGDGHMLTGWQEINGTWYYFKPETGLGYGTMYANTAIAINDSKWGYGNYAFDTNGAMVKNAWFAGHYYGNDGNRTN